MITRRKRLSLAWLLGGLLGVFIIAGGVLATDLQPNQKGTAWDDPDFQGTAAECAAADPAEGTAVWHFVLTSAGSDTGDLTVTFENAGDITQAADSNNGGTLDWNITTDVPDTLLDATTSEGGAQSVLTLSHICANPGTPDGGGSGATEDLPAGTGTVALAVLLLAIGGFGFLASTNRLPKLPKIR
jgi:hypothetical protein